MLEIDREGTTWPPIVEFKALEQALAKRGGTMAGQGGRMGTRLDMVGIFVADIRRMVEFYRDVLMFEVEWDGESPYAEFKNEGVRLSMYERRMLPELLGQEPSYPTGINGTFELAIEMPLFEDVDPAFDRVVALGARPIYAPRDEPWGMRSSMIADPEGNLIEVGSWNKGAG